MSEFVVKMKYIVWYSIHILQLIFILNSIFYLCLIVVKVKICYGHSLYVNKLWFS